MSRYMRTKDTIYEIVDENELVYIVVAKNKKNTYSKSKRTTEILRVANTIEELISRYIVVSGKTKTVVSKYKFNKELKHKLVNQTVFAAIWTSGEHNEPLLKSVAILNHGELELL